MNGFAAFKTSNITPRVLDEIVWPMRQLQMREQEFVCLKALAFLHPEAKGLSGTSQHMIREARNRVLKALYAIILEQNAEDAPTRYGNILLLAPALKALTQLLIENMTLTKFFGLAEVDSLLSEFILDDLNDQTSAPVSIKQHLASPSFTTTANNVNSSGSVNDSANSLPIMMSSGDSSTSGANRSFGSARQYQHQFAENHIGNNTKHQLGDMNEVKLEPQTMTSDCGDMGSRRIDQMPTLTTEILFNNNGTTNNGDLLSLSTTVSTSNGFATPVLRAAPSTTTAAAQHSIGEQNGPLLMGGGSVVRNGCHSSTATNPIPINLDGGGMNDGNNRSTNEMMLTIL